MSKLLNAMSEEPTMAQSPLVCVIISSEHNVAEYRCVLEFQPDVVLIVSSTTERERAQSRRLALLLCEAMPGSQIVVIPADSDTTLVGDQAASITAFVREQLVPVVHKWRDKGYRCVLNATGGTKLMSLLLARALEWDEIHYLALGASALERFSASLERLSQWPLQTEVSILNHARLYLQRVNQCSPMPIENSPHVPEAAAYLLEQYSQAAELSNVNPDTLPWAFLSNLIAKQGYWFGNGRHLGEWVSLSRESLNPDLPAVQRMVTLLAKLGDFIRIENGQLTLVTLHHRASEDWRRWLCGIWFENLINTWLGTHYAGVVYESGLQLHVTPSDHGREGDFLIHDANRLKLVETKVDLPPKQKLATVLDHLSGTAQGLGKVKAYLLLSPAYEWHTFSHLKPKAAVIEREQFITQCRAAGVVGLFVRQPEDLQAVIESQKFLLSAKAGSKPYAVVPNETLET